MSNKAHSQPQVEQMRKKGLEVFDSEKRRNFNRFFDKGGVG